MPVRVDGRAAANDFCASGGFDVEVDGSAKAQLTMSQPAVMKMKEKWRTLAGHTGRGTCGIERLALPDLYPPRIDHAGAAAARPSP